MSKYVAIAIALILLMTLPTFSSLYATETLPPTSSLSVSSRPMHNGRPMIPVPPGPKAEAVKKTPLCPLPSAECTASYNWGGYAATGPTGSVTDVKGSWIVPTLAGENTASGGNGSPCGDTDNSWYDASTWVGIDGYQANSPTVEQTGTSSDCYYGTAYYYAWYEFFPAPEFSPFNVNPGDKMTAEVSFAGGMFTTTITDVTTKTTFTSTPTAVTGAIENSAQWITESAAACVGTLCSLLALLDLSNFGAVPFSASSATISGVTGSIASFEPNVFWILMINLNFPTTPYIAGVKAQPLALKSGGKSFTVNFVSAGP